MGMYTEFNIALELRAEDENVINVLKFMADYPIEEEDLILPSHELFKTARWRFMLLGGSYYFTGKPHCSFKYDDIAKSYFLTVRSNIKNYDDEIELFLDWIKPYLYEMDGDFIGYKMYEEDRKPTLIYFNGITYDFE